MKLTVAADLIQRAYDNSLGGAARDRFDAGGVQAVMLNDATLVIPGTNERGDWARFNFNLGTRGASGRIWHQGFLDHARAVFPFAVKHGARRVIGHSLGAASAQIVAVSMNVPAICFASPRPLRGKRWFKGEAQILNICRWDDAVCTLPPRLFGYRHVGKTCWVSPGETQSEGSHTLGDYLRAMARGRSTPDLPESWA